MIDPATVNPIAIYDFNNYPVELFGSPGNLLWKGKTFLKVIGLVEEASSAGDNIFMDVNVLCYMFNNLPLRDEQKKLIGDFAEWLQHHAALRIQKKGAYCLDWDVYAPSLSGVKTDYGLIFFTGTIDNPTWSWSSLMGLLELDEICAPKVFQSGNDISHEILLNLHWIFAENTYLRDEEYIFEVISHIQNKCHLFVRTLPFQKLSYISSQPKQAREQKSYVYFLLDKSNGAVKIGTTTNPNKRLKTIQCGHSQPLEILKVVEGGYELEAELHKKFVDYKILGEWFKVHKNLTSYIKTLKQADY